MSGSGRFQAEIESGCQGGSMLKVRSLRHAFIVAELLAVGLGGGERGFGASRSHRGSEELSEE
jgi:hypothetical protein